jgi:hypothetical protein
LLDRGIAAGEKLLNDTAFENDRSAIRKRYDDLAVDDLDLRTGEINRKTNYRCRIEINLDPLARWRRGHNDRYGGIGQGRNLRADLTPIRVRTGPFRFRASRSNVRAKRSIGSHDNVGPFFAQNSRITRKCRPSRFGACRRAHHPCREVKMGG